MRFVTDLVIGCFFRLVIGTAAICPEICICAQPHDAASLLARPVEIRGAVPLGSLPQFLSYHLGLPVAFEGRCPPGRDDVVAVDLAYSGSAEGFLDALVGSQLEGFRWELLTDRSRSGVLVFPRESRRISLGREVDCTSFNHASIRSLLRSVFPSQEVSLYEDSPNQTVRFNRVGERGTRDTPAEILNDQVDLSDLGVVPARVALMTLLLRRQGAPLTYAAVPVWRSWGPVISIESGGKHLGIPRGPQEFDLVVSIVPGGSSEPPLLAVRNGADAVAGPRLFGVAEPAEVASVNDWLHERVSIALSGGCALFMALLPHELGVACSIERPRSGGMTWSPLINIDARSVPREEILDQVARQLGAGFEWSAELDGDRCHVVFHSASSETLLSRTVDCSSMGGVTLQELLSAAGSEEGLALVTAPDVTQAVDGAQAGNVNSGSGVDLSDLGRVSARRALAVWLMRLDRDRVISYDADWCWDRRAVRAFLARCDASPEIRFFVDREGVFDEVVEEISLRSD
jgi:hypothetical protein